MNYDVSEVIGEQNRLPIAAAIFAPAAWADGSLALDFIAYSNAEMEVAGLAAGDAITVLRSLSGSHYTAQTVLDAAYVLSSTITANGNYTFPAGASVKWSKTGTGAAPTITVRAWS